MRRSVRLAVPGPRTGASCPSKDLREEREEEREEGRRRGRKRGRQRGEEIISTRVIACQHTHALHTTHYTRNTTHYTLIIILFRLFFPAPPRSSSFGLIPSVALVCMAAMYSSTMASEGATIRLPTSCSPGRARRRARMDPSRERCYVRRRGGGEGVAKGRRSEAKGRRRRRRERRERRGTREAKEMTGAKRRRRG